MGRELKRVALDFEWPFKTWSGYVNPFKSKDCRHCRGSGLARWANIYAEQWYGTAPFDPFNYGAEPLTIDHPAIRQVAERNVNRHSDYYGSGEDAVRRETRRLFKHWQGQWSCQLTQEDVDALVAAGRLWDFTHVPLNEEQKANCFENGWTKEPNGRIPTADEVNTWSMLTMGHDAINRFVCVEARCKREGVPYRCEECEGTGEEWDSPELKVLHDEWKPEEPPAGEGYQLWETTSEGSPVSPVFKTLEELCEYAATNCTTSGSNKVSAEAWRKMLDDNFVYHRDEKSGIIHI